MKILYNNLADALSEKGISFADLASKLGVCEAKIWKKMSGDLEWTVTEAVQICCLLRTSNFHFLFLQLDSKR